MTLSTPVWKSTHYDIAKVIATRDGLVADVFGLFLGARVEGEDFMDLVRATAAYLHVSVPVVFDSMRILAGQPLLPRIAGLTAWRLAGNVKQLRAGNAVSPWVYQRDTEIVPVQVTACTCQRTKRNRIMYVCKLRVMAGSPAAMSLTAWWSRSFCYMLARRLGYTSHRGKFPFSHPFELVNMRVRVLLDPAKTRDGKPGFEAVRCSPSLKRWNRSIIEKRFRRSGDNVWPCPRGFDHYCYACPVGYLDCDAATHRVTVLTKAISQVTGTVGAV